MKNKDIYSKIFAGILLAFVLIYTIHYYNQSDYIIITTQSINDEPIGEGKEFQLPDGTIAKLMTDDAKIVYHKDFIELPQRNVQVFGKVHFDVVENLEKPFYIEIFPAGIQILGTILILRSFPITIVGSVSSNGCGGIIMAEYACRLQCRYKLMK